MLRIVRSPWLLAALALTFTGCATLKSLLAKSFVQPTLTFRDAKVGAVALDQATIHLTFDLENPNPVGLSLAELDYAFFVEGKQVVAGKPPMGLTIPASGRASLTFPTTVKFADIAPVLTTFLTRDTAAYRAQGTVGVKTPIGVVRLPLEHEGSFDVPKLPEVAFGSPRIARLSLTSAVIDLPLKVTNKNGFPLPISGLTGGLSISGARVGTVSTGDLGSLTAKGVRELTLPITVNFLQAASAANAVRSGSGTLTFDGSVKSGATALPLDFSQTVRFTR